MPLGLPLRALLPWRWAGAGLAVGLLSAFFRPGGGVGPGVVGGVEVGVYEGGGYVDKGVYRPWPNCMMNNLHTIDVFCPVCTAAIQKQIDFLCR